MRWTATRIGLAAVLALAGVGPAQARELHWRELAVTAKLDAEGRLHVREVHAMVFDGSWNGGERIFRLGSGQRIELHSIEKLGEDGVFEPLRQGDLSRVDQWDWHEGSAVRWRSRAADDPWFENEELTYAIDYTLSRILIPTEDGYLLDHDFAFPDRDGVIELYSLDFEVDPVWIVSPPAGRFEAEQMWPGRGFVRTFSLEHADRRQLEGVLYPIDERWWWGVLAATLAAIALLFGRFVRRESNLGSFREAEAPGSWDWTWLQENLLSWLPEQAGALWDESIGAPEVAALIARWTSEGKVTSSVEREGRWYRRAVMKLTRNIRQGAFDGYEQRLASGLFYSGRRSVTTEQLRKHYRSKGFVPASRIRSGIESAIKGRLDEDHPPEKPKPWFTVACFVGGILVLVPEFGRFPQETLGWGVLTLVSWLALYLIGLIAANRWRKAVSGLKSRLVWVIAPVLLLAALYSWYLGWFALGPRIFGICALGLFLLGTASSLFNQAATRSSRQRVEARQRLGIARDWLRRELRSARPRLTDDLLPHLLALELSDEVDRWSKSYGESVPTTSFGGGTSTVGSGGGSWTGGGGAFGGAGATGAWTAAAAGLAGGVAAASSSSGGSSGGGGGGSSGGGGGGGW